MRTSVFCSLAATAAIAGLFASVSTDALAEGGNVGVLVLKEHGVGSAAQAQPYVDRLVATAAKQAGWASAKGEYHTNRANAETFISGQKPMFGILSLGAFLGMKGKHNLDVIGQVSVSRAGGQQYHLISKTASDLGGCKGQTLASDHADDAKFIEKVVAKGAFKLGDFTLVATTRPLQTIKKVVNGDAVCALIDDAQYAELGKLDGAANVKSVWASDKLPPMVVVAFPAAGSADRSAFQNALGKICEGDGKATCGEVGISSMKSASASDYAAVVSAYDK